MALLVNDVAPRVQYTATASQTVFAYPYAIFVDGDLTVYHTLSGVTADDTADLQTLTTHYTVSGSGTTAGGNVTLVTGAAVGDIITIERDIAVERTTDYQSLGDLSATSFNDDLDKLVMMVQQNETELARTFGLHRSDSLVTDTKLPAPVAGKSIIWNSSASGFINGPAPTTFTNGDAHFVSSLAGLRTQITAASRAFVSGYATEGDGGGDEFYWNSTSTATDDDGTIVKLDTITIGRYIRLYSGPLNVKWFGVTGDGVTIDYTQLLVAEAAVLDGGTLFYPDGTYNIGANVWTLALKKVHHYSPNAYLSAEVVITGSGGVTIQTESVSGSGLSRGSSFTGMQIQNTKAASGTALWIRNGGIGLKNVVAEASGTTSEGILVYQMWSMKWDHVFCSGSSAALRLWCDGAAGSEAINANHFDMIHCSGLVVAGSTGLIIVGGDRVKANIFNNINVEQADNGINNAGSNNEFSGMNLESTVTGIVDSATCEAIYIAPRVSVSLSNTIGALVEYIPYRNGSGTDDFARKFTGVINALKFAATQVASTDVTTLDDYQEFVSSSTACTGALTVSVVWEVVKVGKNVTLRLPRTQGTATAVGNFVYGATLPAKFRPSESIAFLSPMRDNGVDLAVPGIIYINTSGVVTVYKQMNYATAFTAAAGAGLDTSIGLSWVAPA
jgi:hypothetical protein